MGFKVNSLFMTDGYKIGHKRMLAKGTTRLYGTWIPRSVKYAPKGINKIVSFGQQMTWKWIHDEFKDNFFGIPKEDAVYSVAKDFSMYLGMEYNPDHFSELYDLGYLPIKVKSLPEGIETNPNIPHMTFVNTKKGFAWLTLYLETIVSSLAWKPSTSATISLRYLRNTTEWVNRTDKEKSFLIPYLCHDFSARGLSPWDMISSGLGHAMSFRGSDTLSVIPAARYFYNEPKDKVCIESVNASEHSVSTTKIFTVGEKQMIIDWLKEFPIGILSIVADTFDLWKLLLEYLTDPEVKELIMNRDGKLVIRPDSGDPVDIICGDRGHSWDNLGYSETKDENGDYIVDYYGELDYNEGKTVKEHIYKGVIEILWDIFGGTVNSQGYKVLDPHIGAIYGDSINLERQVTIYKRLAEKGFASTNIVLGVGSFTYQFNTRDTLGFAAKGAWFEVEDENGIKEYDIYKDPITDNGTKKSLKGRICVEMDKDGEYYAIQQCDSEHEDKGYLKLIYEDGVFHNQVSLTQIRELVNTNI